jgi:pyruvate,orthophosphate dikinase
VVDSAQLGVILPTIERQIVSVARLLESEFREVQEFEFTVQDEVLYVLQTRTGKRTALAQLKIACDLAREGVITPAEAVARTADLDLDTLVQKKIAVADGEALARATTAGPGVAIGAIALDVERAKALAAREPVILVRPDATTEDIAGVAVSDGVLTAAGGRTSHAAVVAREINKIALVGCHGLAIDDVRRTCTIGDVLLHEGELICLDGNTGCIYRGRREVVEERPRADIADIERWRKTTGRVGQRSKARAGV